MAKNAIAMPKDFAKQYDKKTFGELAKHYKVSVMTAYRWSKQAGLKKKARKLEIPKDFAKRFYQMRNEDLATHYKVSPAVIWRWSKDLGLEPKRDPGARRAADRKPFKRNGNSKTARRGGRNRKETQKVPFAKLEKYFAEHVDVEDLAKGRSKKTIRPFEGVEVEIRVDKNAVIH